MKRICIVWFVVLCAFSGNYLCAQKKIKSPIIFSTGDTINVNDVILVKKGTLPDGEYNFIKLTSGFNAPAKCEGYEQKIDYFKFSNGVHYAHTVGFVVDLEKAVNAHEANVITKKDVITGTKRNTNFIPKDEISIKSDTAYPIKEDNDFFKIFPTIPWGKQQQDISNLYDKKLNIVSKKNYGNTNYCESFITDIFIGKHAMQLDFVMNNSSQTLSRIVLKPVSKLTDKNVNDICNDINLILESVFGKPITNKKDNSIKIASVINKWMTIDYAVESIYMGNGDFQNIAVSIQPLDKTKNDFRQSKWGDSKSIVKNNEKAEPFVDKDGMLMYKGKLSDLDVTIGYVFVNDLLSRSKYLIDVTHTNQNDYISDYKRLKALLTEKYGTPTLDEVKWRNKLYYDDPENYGMAISVGHLYYYCQWNTIDTEIEIMLHGENFKINHEIEYSSKRYQNTESDKKKDNVLDDL